MTRLALALFLLIAPACAGQSVFLCEWDDPATGARLSVPFSRDAMVVVAPGRSVAVAAAEGTVAYVKDGVPVQQEQRLVFAAPERSGDFFITLRFAGRETKDITLCVHVASAATYARAAKGTETLVGGRSIGVYRHPRDSGAAKVKDNPDSYKPPVWWMYITRENEDMDIMPGMKVGELVAPAEDTGRRHTDILPVSYQMWSAISVLREGLEERGIPGSALRVISLFRTPGYNRGIDSGPFSRHVYGDAFDFAIDLNGDGKADDLNKDGKLNRLDALVVVAIIEELQYQRKLPMGGIGVYARAAGDYGVTMHLDLRGHRAKWGYAWDAGGRKGEFTWASKYFSGEDAEEISRARAKAQAEGKNFWWPAAEPLPR